MLTGGSLSHTPAQQFFCDPGRFFIPLGSFFYKVRSALSKVVRGPQPSCEQSSEVRNRAAKVRAGQKTASSFFLRVAIEHWLMTPLSQCSIATLRKEHWLKGVISQCDPEKRALAYRRLGVSFGLWPELRKPSQLCCGPWTLSPRRAAQGGATSGSKSAPCRSRPGLSSKRAES